MKSVVYSVTCRAGTVMFVCVLMMIQKLMHNADSLLKNVRIDFVFN